MFVREAGIERKISPHSFRHAKAHNILDKSGTVKDIQFILGHSENNPISAFSYLRLNSKEAEKRAKMFL
ncbi:tyrosine-type recombinase/integrase [Candidatus Parcubacteria bacterium]|nr:tyrosine-type recombinase/integrase [Candidatus Parcubacteria bacterium]